MLGSYIFLPAIYSWSREEKFSLCKSKTFEQTLSKATIGNKYKYAFCHFPLNSRVEVRIIMSFHTKMIKYNLICLKLWSSGLQRVKPSLVDKTFLDCNFFSQAYSQWIISSGDNKVDHLYFRHYLKPCLQQIGKKIIPAVKFKKIHFYRGFRLFITHSVDFKVQCNELCPLLKHICILSIVWNESQIYVLKWWIKLENNSTWRIEKNVGSYGLQIKIIYFHLTIKGLGTEEESRIPHKSSQQSRSCQVPGDHKVQKPDSYGLWRINISLSVFYQAHVYFSFPSFSNILFSSINSKWNHV